MTRKKPLTKRLENVASEINTADALEKLYQQNDCYWSVKDIAKYVGKSESTVRRKLLSDPRWPKPFQFGENAYKRWLASEVKKAVLLFREDA